MNIRIFIFIAVIISIGYVHICYASYNTKTTSEQGALFTVIHVYDGDTIAVSNTKKIEKIRFLGIDTPERKDKNGVAQCYSKNAKKYLTKKLLDKKISLQRDELTKNRDVYGRLLRYVTFEGKLVNENLVKEGYAYVYTRSPITKLNEFLAYEKTAREQKRGLWNPKTCDGKRYH